MKPLTIQWLLDALNIHNCRTHTLKLEIYQELELLLSASGWPFVAGGPLYVGGHTIRCEPDPNAPKPYICKSQNQF